MNVFPVLCCSQSLFISLYVSYLKSAIVGIKNCINGYYFAVLLTVRRTV